MWWRRRRTDDDFAREVEAHLQLETDRLIDEGLAAAAARSEAHRRFGNVTAHRERFYESGRVRWLDCLWRDFRYGARMLRKRPAFTAVVVLTLGLGIGVNTTVFGVARAVLLRPLPYAEPEQLVMLWNQDKADPPERGIVTPAQFLSWRTYQSTLTDLAAVEIWHSNPGSRMDFMGDQGAERLRGALVTPNFFPLLGVRAALGRTFGEDIAAANDTQVVVLSDALWRRLGADPSIIGRPLRLTVARRNPDTRRRERPTLPFTVIGVLPPGVRFTYPEETELWAPLLWSSVEGATRQAILYHVVARLKPNVTVEQAQANMAAAADAFVSDNRDEPYWARATVRVESLHDYVTGEARSTVLLLLGVVCVLLLLACINAANLLLARLLERQREIALRTALGASPARIVWQLAIEAGMLTAVGGAVGLLLVSLTLPVLQLLIPDTLPRGNEVELDGWVLAFAAALSAMITCLVGIAPGAWAARLDPQRALQCSGHASTADRHATRWRRGLVVTQAAAVLVLMVGAWLLLDSVRHLHAVDLGFDGDSVLTMEMRLLNIQYQDEQRLRAFQDEVITRVRAVPGVVEASMSSSVPFRGVDWMLSLSSPSVPAFDERVIANRRDVDWRFFSLMRIPLRSGRLFDERDGTAGPPVAILSESAARKLFPTGEPLGKMVVTGRQEAEIIGIVGDVRWVRTDELPSPAVYVPKSQLPSSLICLLIRTAPGAAGVATAVKDAIRAVDPEQPVQRVTTVDQIVATSLAEQRFSAVAAVAFALLGLALSVVGIYGVVARMVGQRTREIGIRRALGAENLHILWWVLVEGLGPVVLGLVAGTVAGFLGLRFMRSYLFEVTPGDPIPYGAAGILLITVAALACVLPARRATKVDPMVALRAE